MKRSELPGFARAILDNYLLPLLEKKGRDTGEIAGPDAPNADHATANMAEQARVFAGRGIDKYDIAAIARWKHEQAILTWVNSRDKDGHRGLESEAIHMRLVDTINYAMLMWSMGIDDGIMPDPRTSTESGDYPERSPSAHEISEKLDHYGELRAAIIEHNSGCSLDHAHVMKHLKDLFDAYDIIAKNTATESGMMRLEGISLLRAYDVACEKLAHLREGLRKALSLAHSELSDDYMLSAVVERLKLPERLKLGQR